MRCQIDHKVIFLCCRLITHFYSMKIFAYSTKTFMTIQEIHSQSQILYNVVSYLILTKSNWIYPAYYWIDSPCFTLNGTFPNSDVYLTGKISYVCTSVNDDQVQSPLHPLSDRLISEYRPLNLMLVLAIHDRGCL